MTGTFIHPTAIIETGAELGQNVSIGPYCVVGPNVILHDNIVLKSHIVMAGHTIVGENTKIYPFSSIGEAPQDLKYRGEPSTLLIGKNNVIREHVTMHPGTQDGGMETVVGDNGLFMIGVHIAHDCRVGNNVIMANGSAIAGHVVVGNNVLIGGMSAIHQFIRIGDHAVVGGMSAVDKDIIPFGRVRGERAFLEGLNLTGLERNGYDKDQIRQLQKAFKAMFNGEGTFEDRLNQVELDFHEDPTVKKIIEFAKTKDKFPICQPQQRSAA